MAFPVSVPDDGLIDIMAMPLVCQVTYSHAPPLIPLSPQEKMLYRQQLAQTKGKASGQRM